MSTKSLEAANDPNEQSKETNLNQQSVNNSSSLSSTSPNPLLFISSKVGSFLKKGENIFSTNKIRQVNGVEKFGENIYFYDILPNGGYEPTTEFLQKVVEMMYKHIQLTNDRKEKILDFQYPHDLKRKVNLELEKDPKNLSQILDDCQMVINTAVKTGHPRFFNQLSQGLDIVSLAGEWITAVTNTNMFTYEIAPMYNLIEEVTLKKMRDIIGWKDGDGIFNPGGSISNLYAAQIAKHFHFPETKKTGLFNLPKMIVFTSEHSHYSVERAVAILGIGTNQIRSVPVDERGKLIPEKLEEMVKKSIAAKERPFLVTLTAGTTVLGAFDPIDTVSIICKKYNMWLHVDAAWGGGALLSSKHKHLLKGIEEADSVTWNPHKLMGALLQSSAFLVKKKGLLLSCNEMNATYLFQQDKHYDVHYDTGDKTIQCGRHVDVFKVWLMWRAKGDAGFEKQVNKLFDLANLLYEQLKIRENFDIVLYDPEFVNICFWYVPKSIQHLDKKSNEYKQKLNKIAPQIKEQMMMKGSLMVGYQPLDDKPNFFRAIISNAASTEEDILFMLDEIERLGCNL